MAISPSANPIAEFERLFDEVATSAVAATADPTEMTLATVGADGAPSARTVLLKAVGPDGFEFFTNYESRKGRELAADPRAALVFRWPWANLQVRAEGVVARLSDAESDAYFASRARGHQLGAWASAQSRPIESMAALAGQVAEAEKRFAGVPVPRPPYWGGFRLRPLAIEFWHAGVDRLHERRRFRRTSLLSTEWSVERLSP